MLPYCLKCRKNTESKNPKVVKTYKGRIMFFSRRAVCDSMKPIVYQRVRSEWIIK